MNYNLKKAIKSGLVCMINYIWNLVNIINFHSSLIWMWKKQQWININCHLVFFSYLVKFILSEFFSLLILLDCDQII